MKKLLLSTLFLMASIPSVYAYNIEQKLTIDNKTDIPMFVRSTQGKLESVDFVDRGKTVKIPFNNNDHSGWLNKRATVAFSIQDAGSNMPYVNGRVVFFVGRLIGTKYSFMDSITQSPGITVNQYYTCENGGNQVFQNKLEISGSPIKAAPALVDEHKIRCENRVLSSEVTVPWDRAKKYAVTCFNHKQAEFVGTYLNDNSRCDPLDLNCPGVWKYFWSVPGIGRFLTELDITKDQLDKKIGAEICKGWEEG